MKINLPMMSKSNVQEYIENIIQPSSHRIISLKISNAVMYDLAFSSMDPLSQYHRIQTLTFDDIDCESLSNILDQLSSLPFLSSLTISTAEPVKDINQFYHQIFRLSALKYCKLSLNEYNSQNLLRASVNEYSPIEHLVITSSVHINIFDNLLSYIPQLRRLSLLNLCASSNTVQVKSWHPMGCLTNFSCRFKSKNLHAFEEMLRNIGAHIQVLYLTFDYDLSANGIDAKKWEELIIYSLDCIGRVLRNKIVCGRVSGSKVRGHIII